METVKLSHAGKIITLPKPKRIDEVVEFSKRQFGISRPSFKYLDEDNELITVQTQLEYEEALVWVQELDAVIQVEELGTLGQSRLSQFIDELPLLRSQITNEPLSESIEESVVLEVIVDRSNSPRNNVSDKCTGQDLKIDAQIQMGTLPKVDSSMGTQINSIEMGIGKDKFDQESSTNVEVTDKFCEPKEFTTEVKMNGPDIAEKAQNTEIMKNQETGTEKVDVNSIQLDTNPVVHDQIENQFDKISFEDDLRKLVREEMSKAGSLRLSQICHTGIECSLCHSKPIFGIRYQCVSCLTFNLCEACEDATEHEHNLLKLKRPQEKIISEFELMVEKIKHMGFTDEEKIRKLLHHHNSNLDDTVSDLLKN